MSQIQLFGGKLSQCNVRSVYNGKLKIITSEYLIIMNTNL